MPQTQRCLSRDGSSIAYVVLGSGVPLVVATSWTTTVEQQLTSDYSAPFLERIAHRRQVVLYDRRGVGASQRDASDVTLPAQVDDLQSVLEARGIEECDVLGDNDGCYVAVAFAARSPRQVRRMALWAPLVTGKDARPQAMREFAQLMRTDWAAARAQWAAYRAPAGTDDERRQVADAFEAMISPEVAASYLECEGVKTSLLCYPASLRRLSWRTRAEAG